MNVALYTRVSTPEQAREGYSIGEQTERLKSFCNAKCWSVYNIYTDAGFSGSNMNRPALRQMISDMPEIDMVLVYKLDRLSRSQKDTLYLIEDVFLAANTHFASLTENFDTSTPLGRAMIGILSVFAQLEREQFKERSQMGRDARAKEGLYHGGLVPIGYDYINGMLVINEYEAMQIREIYRMFLEGASIHQIINNMSKYRHKYGQWSRGSRIRYVLKNALYAGWTHNRGELYKGRHKAIIEQNIFDEARKRLAAHSGETLTFAASSLLSGFLWCGKCGARFFKIKKSSKKNGKTYTYDKYICYSRYGHAEHMIRDRHCKNKIISCHKLDSIILNILQGLVINPRDIKQLIENQTSTHELRERRAVLNRIDELECALTKLTELYTLSAIDVSVIARRSEEIAAERRALEERLSLLEASSAIISDNDRQRLSHDIIQFPANLHEQRSIIDVLIKRIEINDDDVFITWKFS